MPRPRLIHPIDIVVQREDKAQTFVDNDYREPVQQAARKSTFTVKGQISWKWDQRINAQPGGPREDSDGYIVFRVYDLGLLGETISRGDRFTKIGKIDSDVYVIRVVHLGHWPDQGGATLLQAFFKDRQPGKQNRGNL